MDSPKFFRQFFYKNQIRQTFTTKVFYYTVIVTANFVIHGSVTCEIIILVYT